MPPRKGRVWMQGLDDNSVVLDEVVKSYGRNKALDGLTISVHAGEVFGLLGPNGAGKTTAIRILGGVLTPDSGAVFVNGLAVTVQNQQARSVLGVVSEGAGLYGSMTVEENLVFFARLYSLQPDTVKRRLGELYDLLDLGRLRDRRCNELSTGQRKRACIARALIHDPGVLLLDEPWTGLDPVTSRTVRLHIADLARRQHRTILLCTHGLAEAAEICSRVAIMVSGRVRAMGPPEDLCDGAGPIMYIFRGEAGLPSDDWWAAQEGVLAANKAGAAVVQLELASESVVPGLLTAAAENGAGIVEARRAGLTLEDAYIRTVTAWNPNASRR